MKSSSKWLHALLEGLRSFLLLCFFFLHRSGEVNDLEYFIVQLIRASNIPLLSDLCFHLSLSLHHVHVHVPGRGSHVDDVSSLVILSMEDLAISKISPMMIQIIIAVTMTPPLDYVLEAAPLDKFLTLHLNFRCARNRWLCSPPLLLLLFFFFLCMLMIDIFFPLTFFSVFLCIFFLYELSLLCGRRQENRETVIASVYEPLLPLFNLFPLPLLRSTLFVYPNNYTSHDCD